jgi:hypothetical protein
MKSTLHFNPSKKHKGLTECYHGHDATTEIHLGTQVTGAWLRIVTSVRSLEAVRRQASEASPAVADETWDCTTAHATFFCRRTPCFCGQAMMRKGFPAVGLRWGRRFDVASSGGHRFFGRVR